MTKAERRNRAIAQAINSLECAHIDRSATKLGTPLWHRATAQMYEATAALVELGIPMTLGSFFASGEAQQGLMADAAANRSIAAAIEARAA